MGLLIKIQSLRRLESKAIKDSGNLLNCSFEVIGYGAVPLLSAMKQILILIISLLSFSNIYAQISGDDIIDPLWSDNKVCVYLKEFTSKIKLVVYNNYEDSIIYINDAYLLDVNDNIIFKKHLGNNYITNDLIFDVQENDNVKLVITINNGDNWEYEFDKGFIHRWYDMVKCKFTNIQKLIKNIYFNKKYSLDGKQFYYNKLYIINGKKIIKMNN